MVLNWLETHISYSYFFSFLMSWTLMGLEAPFRFWIHFVISVSVLVISFFLHFLNLKWFGRSLYHCVISCNVSHFLFSYLCHFFVLGGFGRLLKLSVAISSTSYLFIISLTWRGLAGP